MTEDRVDELQEHVGAWIDPLLWTGLALVGIGELPIPASTTADGIALVGGLFGLSLLWIVGVTYAPALRATDRAGDLTAAAINRRRSA